MAGHFPAIAAATVNLAARSDTIEAKQWWSDRTASQGGAGGSWPPRFICRSRTLIGSVSDDRLAARQYLARARGVVSNLNCHVQGNVVHSRL